MLKSSNHLSLKLPGFALLCLFLWGCGTPKTQKTQLMLIRMLTSFDPMRSTLKSLKCALQMSLNL